MKRVFVDTNIIIEAHRIECWNIVAGAFELHTVEQVKVEALQGRKSSRDYVPVDAHVFDSCIQVHRVEQADLAKAILGCRELLTLDDGERDLLAYLQGHLRDADLLSTADAAAVRVACLLGFGDNLVSLEELLQSKSKMPGIRSTYLTNSLRRWKTQFTLEHL